MYVCMYACVYVYTYYWKIITFINQFLYINCVNPKDSYVHHSTVYLYVYSPTPVWGVSFDDCVCIVLCVREIKACLGILC